MYSFESSSDQPEQEDKAIYFVHPQEQLTQLANEFNIRYSPTFDPASQNTFSVNQDLLQTNNNAQYELPSFHAFHGIHTEQAILHDLSHPPSVYKSFLQPENTASSPSSVFTAKPTTTTLLPLHTTPIKTAPFEPQISMHPLMSKTKNAPRPGRERAPWTAEEDRLLRLAVALYGDKTEKWSKIAACVPGRTNKNCRKRWFHSLDPLLRKGAWTEKEDQLLREGVSRYPNQWSKIADRLQGRTDDQCAKRWRESLDPTIDRSDWTEAEDARLMEKYETYGSQWQKIACFFEGRPGLHCRNRWRKLERVLQIKQKSLKPSFVNTLLKRKVQPALQDTHPALDSPSCCSPTRPAQAVQDDVRRQSAATPNRAEDEFSDGLRPYGCGVPGCHAAFSSSSGLFNHMKTPHDSLDRIDKPYRCTIKNCSKRYKNINGLQYHLKDAKSTTAYGHSTLFEDKPFPCTLSSCKKTYRTLSGLRYHLQHGHNKEPELVSFDPFQTNQNPL